jgi:hypothetical protein
MSKIEITPPLNGYQGMKELRLGFHKSEDEFGYNADVNVWVKQSDSVSAMHSEAAQKAKFFSQRCWQRLKPNIHRRQSKPYTGAEAIRLKFEGVTRYL